MEHQLDKCSRSRSTGNGMRRLPGGVFHRQLCAGGGASFGNHGEIPGGSDESPVREDTWIFLPLKFPIFLRCMTGWMIIMSSIRNWRRMTASLVKLFCVNPFRKSEGMYGTGAHYPVFGNASPIQYYKSLLAGIRKIMRFMHSQPF